MVENINFPDFDNQEEKKDNESKFAVENEEQNQDGFESAPEANERSAEEGEQQEDVSLLKEQLGKALEERDEYLLHLKRLQAEFDNFRKRTQREKVEMREYLVQEFITRMLDVADSLERALNSGQEEGNVDSYRSGVEMVYQQFMTVLGEFGVSRVNSVGEKFDPNFHEAIAQLPTEEHEAGTIVLEITPGYQLKDRIIRAPRVQVATNPNQAEQQTN